MKFCSSSSDLIISRTYSIFFFSHHWHVENAWFSEIWTYRKRIIKLHVAFYPTFAIFLEIFNGEMLDKNVLQSNAHICLSVKKKNSFRKNIDSTDIFMGDIFLRCCFSIRSIGVIGYADPGKKLRMRGVVYTQVCFLLRVSITWRKKLIYLLVFFIWLHLVLVYSLIRKLFVGIFFIFCRKISREGSTTVTDLYWSGLYCKSW